MSASTTLAAVLLCALAAAPAGAVETPSSEITSPTDPLFVFGDNGLVTPEKYEVAGKVNGGGTWDVRCYSGTTGWVLVAEAVKVDGEGRFGFASSVIPGSPCVLRAVPHSENTPRPPGEAGPFTGPRLAGGEVYGEEALNEAEERTGTFTEFTFMASELRGYAEILPAGQCGLNSSGLYDRQLTRSPGLFECAGTLSWANETLGGTSTRSDIEVDGHQGYDSYGAVEVGVLTGGPPKKPPTATITAKPSLDGTTLTEESPIGLCANPDEYPPTKTSCASFTASGVKLTRTWQVQSEGRVIALTDTWSSSDGKPHKLDLRYDHQLASNTKSPAASGTAEFPGEAAFSAPKKRDTHVMPAGGAIFYKVNGETPEVGNGADPIGAIIADRAPTAAATVFRGSSEVTTGITVPYTGEATASAPYTLRMAFVQEYALPEARALARSMLSAWRPSVSIASPADGAGTEAASILVTGTASDSEGLSSLTVAGIPVEVAKDGSWSVSVPLALGDNTIQALATNVAGLTRSASIAVGRAAPPAEEGGAGGGRGAGAGGAGASGRPAPALLALAFVNPGSSAAGITLALECAGPAGASCAFSVAAVTTERLQGSTVRSLSARTRRVTVASARVTLASGGRTTVRLQLTATGRALLAKFHRLPVRVTARSGALTLLSKAITLTAPRQH